MNIVLRQADLSDIDELIRLRKSSITIELTIGSKVKM